MPIATYLTGLCVACQRRFRWPTNELKVKDAACLGCDGPLTRTRSSAAADVEHVDADWVRKETHDADATAS